MDANWVGNVLDRRLTSGFMFFFGSGAVSWSNKKQPIVALSSTEAEYRGAAIVACEVVWFQKLLSNLGQSVDAPIISIVITSVAYYLLTTWSIMLGQSTLEKKF